MWWRVAFNRYRRHAPYLAYQLRLHTTDEKERTATESRVFNRRCIKQNQEIES